MTCHIGTNVIACGPPGVYRRAIRSCPVCERRHRFVISWDGAWYGETLYGSCGDHWQDGELGSRPFRKGWRKEAQVAFRNRWANTASPEAYDRYVRADCSLAVRRSSPRSERKAIRKRVVAYELIRRERVG